MIPKHANIGFNPLKASQPKPATNLMPKLPPIPGMGQVAAKPTIPATSMGASAATMPKIAASKTPANAAPVLMPIPPSGPVTSIAKAPEMREMRKVPSLKKIAFDKLALNPQEFLSAMKALKGRPGSEIVSGIKSRLTPLAITGKEIMSPVSKVAPFAVGANRLATMGNVEARNLLGAKGVPPIPKSNLKPSFSSGPTVPNMTPPPLPGKPAMQHGTVVNRFLGK
jgi:hypothetical protein